MRASISVSVAAAAAAVFLVGTLTTIGAAPKSLGNECAVTGLVDRLKPSFVFIITTVDAEKYLYDGATVVQLTVGESADKAGPRNVIALHASKNVAIYGAVFIAGSDDKRRKIPVKSICRDDENQLVVLTLAENLPLGVGTVYLAFKGEVEDNGKGIYKHKPTKDDNSLVKVNLADNSARFVYPCFDKLNLKTNTGLVVRTQQAFNVTSSSLELQSTSVDQDGFLNAQFKISFVSLDQISFEIRK